MQIKHRKAKIVCNIPTISPLLQRIYAVRGIEDEKQLELRLQALIPFHSLRDIEKACLRLQKALEEQQRILIIGDFDADGATSTAVAMLALQALGASEVDFLVCNRFEFGYGLTPGIVQLALKKKPQLIITVDNGISSLEGVAEANINGIDVIITDHHLPPEVLPEAYAIVNPNQQQDVFPSKSIAGVGVIYYLMLALRRTLVNANWFSRQGKAEPNMAQFLDLVALGTVADVVGLDQNNRILVHQGLLRIRQGLASPGIQALVEVSGRVCAELRETDLGFSLAPRLNAAGRLDDMSLGIECLLAKDFAEAKRLAQMLDELNRTRRTIEAEMQEQAYLAIQQWSQKVEGSSHIPKALCLMDASWHQGVIGILAGRLKDKFHRPVIAFAKVSEEELKGSARSVAGIHIRDILANIDKTHKGLIIKFGGHAMAAGLSLCPKDFLQFKEAFLAEIQSHLDEEMLKGVLLTDGPLQVDEINLEIAEILQAAGPWGQQFPEPCFDGVFQILDQRIVGNHHLKLTLVHPQGGPVIDAIAFQIDKELWPNHRVKSAHIAYKLQINCFQQRRKLQLLIEAIAAYEEKV